MIPLEVNRNNNHETLMGKNDSITAHGDRDKYARTLVMTVDYLQTIIEENDDLLFTN